MYFKDDAIVFKSRMPLFEKERCGDKPNTVRVLTDEESDEVIKEYTRTFANVSKITIVDATSKNKEPREFTRKLTDISFTGALLGYRIAVFSWKHEE